MEDKEKTMLLDKVETLVTFKTGQGTNVQVPVSRLTAHLVVFEVNDSNCVLRTSEVLNEFKIKFNNREAYAGRAVIANLINTGSGILCEANLDGIGLDVSLLAFEEGPTLKKAFNAFLVNWGKNYRIHPDFKVLIADMNSYLSELRLWLEHVQLSIRLAPAEKQAALEEEALAALREPVIDSLNALFEKFELVASKVSAQDKPAHRNWVRRQIHPLILAAPFADRTYHKPLGYAGDYEMVNMILRNPHEGESLFAKALNAWFLSQPPAEAHRNRIKHLKQQLINETARTIASGRKARIFNLGCGPAGEVQRFLAESDLSNHAEFTLLDFNDETLSYTTRTLNQSKEKYQRSTSINLTKKSVAQILMGRGKSSITASGAKYDLVYCAGLFDYLPDSYCRQLMDIFYEMLAPGGLLIATNVDAVNPIQQMLDYVLDWVLIYRNGSQLASVAPQKADSDRISVSSDVTSVNIYLEVRKPAL